MKLKIMTTATIAIMLLASQGQAIVSLGLVGCNPANRSMADCPPFFSLVCAPEVKKGNVDATMRILNGYAQGSLAQREQFVKTVSGLNALEQDQKISHLFKSIGIKDEAGVAEFVGAREVSAENVKTFAQSTGITESEARQVATSVAKALLGEQQ